MKSETKKFIIKSLFFCLTFLLVLSVLNAYYVRSMLSKTIVQRTEDQFQNYKNETKIIFFGDSHVKNGVDPRLIPESFNYALAGENYAQTFYKLKKVLSDEEVKVEKIVLPIDVHSFSSWRSDRFLHEWYWRDFIDYSEVARRNPEIGLIEKIVISRFPVIDSGGEFVNNLLNEPDISDLFLGATLLTGDYSENDKQAEGVKSTLKTQLIGYELIDDFLWQYFVDTIELAQENDAEVFLVRYPLSDSYLKGLADKGIEKHVVYNKVRSMIKDKRNIKILDYHELFVGQDELFSNSDHLNAQGATGLSEKIAEDLKT